MTLSGLKYWCVGCILLFFVACGEEVVEEPVPKIPDYVLVIHGGAGIFAADQFGSEREFQILKIINEALDIGEDILSNGGSSLDAVEKVIVFLEDNPEFNAGKGAVFTSERLNELDASIMDGATLDGGAVGGVRTVKNPISAARKVMTESPHVFLAGRGAEQFAASVGCEVVDNEYFFTQERFDVLLRVIENEQDKKQENESNIGTVGAVALDKGGNLAAGTSTGGMTNKKFGRIGDSPILGAGTYADNDGVAVSCTGHGEYFIRNAVAYDLNALVKYREISLDSAARHIIHEKLAKIGASGGLIAIDRQGNYTMPFNTRGMIRGMIRDGEERKVAIFK